MRAGISDSAGGLKRTKKVSETFCQAKKHAGRPNGFATKHAEGAKDEIRRDSRSGPRTFVAGRHTMLREEAWQLYEDGRHYDCMYTTDGEHDSFFWLELALHLR